MPQAVQREGFVENEVAEPVKVSPIRAAETAPLPPSEPATEAELEPVRPNIFVVTWPMRIKLQYRAIRNNKNEEISEIMFREPTGGDINRYGSPIRMSNVDGGWDIVDDRMAMIMAALSGINLPLLQRMDPRDWNSCAYRLRLYFQPDTTGWL